MNPSMNYRTVLLSLLLCVPLFSGCRRAPVDEANLPAVATDNPKPQPAKKNSSESSSGPATIHDFEEMAAHTINVENAAQELAKIEKELLEEQAQNKALTETKSAKEEKGAKETSEEGPKESPQPPPKK